MQTAILAGSHARFGTDQSKFKRSRRKSGAGTMRSTPSRGGVVVEVVDRPPRPGDRWRSSTKKVIHVCESPTSGSISYRLLQMFCMRFSIRYLLLLTLLAALLLGWVVDRHQLSRTVHELRDQNSRLRAAISSPSVSHYYGPRQTQEPVDTNATTIEHIVKLDFSRITLHNTDWNRTETNRIGQSSRDEP